MSASANARSAAGRLSAGLGPRDELGVALFPDRLVIARVGGAWRRRIKHKEAIELAPRAAGAPAWQAALEALVRKVMEGTLAEANVTLVLSSHFVHYVLVPGSELLRGEADQQAFVRERLRSIHGAAAESWALRLSQAGPRRPRLACGVPQTLIEALNEVMAPLGRRFRSLQPHLMASFNRWRARLGKSCWFVAAEPGLACLALLEAGEWRSVRTVRIGADWPQALPGVLMRERFLVDGRSECSDVRVFAPGLPAAVVPDAGDWRVENLQAAPMPGRAARPESPYAIAMGA